jgi:hypothetical protein
MARGAGEGLSLLSISPLRRRLSERRSPALAASSCAAEKLEPRRIETGLELAGEMRPAGAPAPPAAMAELGEVESAAAAAAEAEEGEWERPMRRALRPSEPPAPPACDADVSSSSSRNASRGVPSVERGESEYDGAAKSR